MSEKERKAKFIAGLQHQIDKGTMCPCKITVIENNEGFNTHETINTEKGYISIDQDGVTIIDIGEKRPFSLHLLPNEENHELKVTVESTFKKEKNGGEITR